MTSEDLYNKLIDMTNEFLDGKNVDTDMMQGVIKAHVACIVNILAQAVLDENSFLFLSNIYQQYFLNFTNEIACEHFRSNDE